MKNFYKATLLLAIHAGLIFLIVTYFPHWYYDLFLGIICVLVSVLFAIGYILFGVKAFKENVFMGGGLLAVIGAVALISSVALFLEFLAYYFHFNFAG